MAKKSGGLSSHFDRPSKRRRGKSAFDVLGNSLRGKKGKRRNELGGGKWKTGDFLAKSFQGRGRKKPIKDRESAMDFGRMVKRRLTPTEKAELNQAVERAMEEDDSLKNKKTDATLTGDETFVQRLTRIVRERLRR